MQLKIETNTGTAKKFPQDGLKLVGYHAPLYSRPIFPTSYMPVKDQIFKVCGRCREPGYAEPLVAPANGIECCPGWINHSKHGFRNHGDWHAPAQAIFWKNAPRSWKQQYPDVFKDESVCESLGVDGRHLYLTLLVILFILVITLHQ
jgi:hypothetical protein